MRQRQKSGKWVSQAISLAAVSGLMLGAATPATAEELIGLTQFSSLLRFDSATPGTITGEVTISGLVFGDSVVGIDRRPSLGPNNGALYGLGYNSALGTLRIYTLNTMTGAATLVSTLVADPADTTAPFPYTGSFSGAYGIDFNPVEDRLRVTSQRGENLRINVDTGATQLDVPLAYQAGDPNFGMPPAVGAVAYSNNFGGATTTELRGVDSGLIFGINNDPDRLVLHTNPNGGTLATILTLPFSSTSADISAYDISGLSGTPYFAVGSAGSASSQLYAAGPGGITLVGTIGNAGTRILLGLAAPVGAQAGTPQVIPEPGTLTLAVTGLLPLVGVIARRRRHRA